jgi:hypothetical protein
MNVDPAASMRCWAIEVELAGRVFEIPALPAADWWPVLVDVSVSGVMDLFSTSQDDLDEMLLSGEVDGAGLHAALTEALEEAAGRTAHAAFVLASIAHQNWPVLGGQLAAAGFLWDVQPLGAALDALYHLITSGLPEESTEGGTTTRPRDQFHALLDNEAVVGGKPTEQLRRRAVTGFEAMAGPRPTTGARATGEQSGSARPRTRPRPRPPRPGGQSGAPRTPRVPRADSGPAASSGPPPDVAGPASGTGPPPLPEAR